LLHSTTADDRTIARAQQAADTGSELFVVGSDDTVVVDAHNDLLLLVDRRPPVEQAAYFRERWLPQLRAGGVGIQVLPVFAADLRSVLRMIGAAHRVAEATATR